MNDPSVRDLAIALSLLPFLTPNRTRLLMDSFDSLELACNATATVLASLLSLPPELAAQVRNPLTPAVRDRVRTLRNSVITIEDEAYPALLREIPDPPLVLHVRGDSSLLTGPALAIVGSRRASPYAINVATRFATELGGAGLLIVSGLARGVDAAAHRAALACGAKTVAVLGTGIDLVYPAAHRALFDEIAREGLLVSEFPPGTPPRRENFPIRNRLISGMTLGTLVVEASARSGSLITARMAAEQNREVFAVPGPIFSAGSEGTHRLIQAGAKLTHTATDVLEELPGDLVLAPSAREEVDASLAGTLATLRLDEARHIDDVAAATRRSAGEVAEALLELELAGWIRALPGARYVRTR
jgi:DNA processing protein